MEAIFVYSEHNTALLVEPYKICKRKSVCETRSFRGKCGFFDIGKAQSVRL